MYMYSLLPFGSLIQTHSCVIYMCRQFYVTVVSDCDICCVCVCVYINFQLYSLHYAFQVQYYFHNNDGPSTAGGAVCGQSLVESVRRAL